MSDNRPIAMVGEESVLDDLLRLAAAAGCELERVPDLAGLRGRWKAAPLVLLDTAAATALAASPMTRRQGVLVVSQEEPDASAWEQALAVGAEQVLALPTSEERLVSTFADVVDGPPSAAGRVLAVAGGRGGAGSSLLTAAVALAALRAKRNALLVDADPLGGGVDLVLGAEGEDGLRWPDLRLSRGRVAVSSLRSALPGRGNGSARLTVLSCDRAGNGPKPAAMAAVVESGRRSGELVLCDLPRETTETSCVALERADLAVLVVPAEVRACAAARVVARRMRDCGARPSVVVRGPAPGALRASEVAAAVDAPLLVAMRPEPSVDAALERGELRTRPRGPLTTTAGKVLDALDEAGMREAA